MKITLINGSPKRRDSASGVILSQLKGYMKNDASLCELHFLPRTRSRNSCRRQQTVMS